MTGFYKKCFVCNIDIIIEEIQLNKEVNLPVCRDCKGTTMEKETIIEYLDSLAEGLVCGCI